MLNLRSKRTLDYIWNKLADWATGGKHTPATSYTIKTFGTVISQNISIGAGGLHQRLELRRRVAAQHRERVVAFTGR